MADAADAKSQTPDAETMAWFNQVFADHFPLVYGYLRARVLDHADAEDLAQEVFMRFYNGLHRYDREAYADPRPWLRGIARNVLREHIRRIKKRREVGWTELCLELDQLIGSDADDDERMALLPLCLSKLGDSAAYAIQHHYMGGMKLKDIARRMGRTLGAVKVLMVRSRQALKRCIDAQIAERREADQGATQASQGA